MSRSNGAQSKKASTSVAEKPRAFASPLLGLARLFSSSPSSKSQSTSLPAPIPQASASPNSSPTEASLLSGRPAKPRQLRVDHSNADHQASKASEEKSITQTEKSFTPAPRPVSQHPSSQSSHGSTTRPKVTTKSKQDEKRAVIILGFMAVALGIGLSLGDRFSLNADSGQDLVANARAEFDARKIEERVRYHRDSTGMKLNRERIQVEYQNHFEAPTLSAGAERVAPKNMMNGLPLASERHHRETSRERSVVANPDFPEERIMYELQDEQAAREWAESARKAYIKEFIENAQRAGYAVKIDKNGVARIVGKLPPNDPRRPALESSKMDYSKGSVR